MLRENIKALGNEAIKPYPVPQNLLQKTQINRGISVYLVVAFKLDRIIERVYWPEVRLCGRGLPCPDDRSRLP